MIQRFTEVLDRTHPTMPSEVKFLIANRFTESMAFITERPDMIENRYTYYVQTGVFERHIYLDYGLRPIENRDTTLKAMMDVAFELKTLAKLQARQASSTS